MAQIDYGEIEEVLGTIFGEKIGFESMIRHAIDGGNLFDVSTWIERLREVFVQQIQSQRQLLGALFGLIIMAAILAVVSKAFRNKQISLIYLILHIEKNTFPSAKIVIIIHYYMFVIIFFA